MPNLVVGDDYGYFENVCEEDGPFSEGLSRSKLKSELAPTWGFDYDTMGETFARMDTLFDQSKFENLALSEPGLVTLRCAKIFTIPDLARYSKEDFIWIAKPSPEVFQEVDDAMSCLGYSFKASGADGGESDEWIDTNEFMGIY